MGGRSPLDSGGNARGTGPFRIPRRYNPGMRSLALLLGLACVFSDAVGSTQPDRNGFQNSGSDKAQTAFLDGLAALHNFEYLTAAEKFREAQKIDPGFVMAYWGEAMTHTHPIWYQQDAGAARAVLARLAPTREERRALAATPREKAYLEAVEILYGEGTKKERDIAYLQAMERLHAQFPDDVDAAAFRALAVLGTSHEGRDTALYMKAAAILEEVFPENRRHPGVLHYLIHSYDDPVHAPLGMRAARLYGDVAPDAGHALHMTSHIFIAMGMWDDVIDANRRAVRVVDAQRTARGKGLHRCGHYPTWLHYGLIQKGDGAAARASLEDCRAVVTDESYQGLGIFDTAENRAVEYARMVAAQVAGGLPLRESERVDLPASFQEANLTLAYAGALDAYQRADREALEQAQRRMLAIQSRSGDVSATAHACEAAAMGSPDVNEGKRRKVVMDQVEAMLLVLNGRRSEAIAALERAAEAEDALPFMFGPPTIEKPSRELLADLLASSQRSGDAAREYRRALLRTPGRSTIVAPLQKMEAAPARPRQTE